MSVSDRATRTLKDFLDFAEAGARLVARGKDAYDSDEMLRLAAEAILHRVGEVVARLDRDDPSLVAEHPEVRWRAMKGMKNVVAHDYGALDPEIVWTTLETNLPHEAQLIHHIFDTLARDS